MADRNNKKQSIKICFAASTGGHYEQLMMLKPLMLEFDSFIVSEKTIYNAGVNQQKTYLLKQTNRREILLLPKLLINSMVSFGILLKEKPDVIISTGVLTMVPICLLAKLLRKKLIFIESFAKVTSPTLSGRILYHFADRFYVQWETMLKIYPKAIYKGGIY